jgi:hypothetical protein
MNGGLSHVDTFDPKPMLDKYDGQPMPGPQILTSRKTGNLMKSPFKFTKHGKSGIEMSELWPHLGTVADDMCVIRSMYAEIPNHEPCITLMNTGSNLIGRPSMGSWITYGLGTMNQNLPGFVVLTPTEPLTIGNMPIVVSASIGIALYPEDGHDPESLLRNADSAMYRAKEAGRSNVQLCTDEMKKRALERLAVESRLRTALHDSQLMLAYQPQVNLVTGRTIGVEALVRWNDPVRGVVEPASFIPIAEETRLILPLGEWVLRTARTIREAGNAVETVVLNGPYGHLNGIACIGQAGPAIARFLER